MTNYYHVGLAALMLITGSINTLSVKWADTMVSESSDGKIRGFHHPFLQANGMFMGEMLCMAAYFMLRFWKSKKQTPEENSRDPVMQPRNFSPVIFLGPAVCDMLATSTMYVGLTFTYASSFQMLRGAVIVFTGLFSRFFLRHRLGAAKWIGIACVLCGLIVVGLCDILYGGSDKAEGGDDDGKNATALVEAVHFHADYFGGIIRGLTGGAEGGHGHSTGDIIIGDVLIVCAQVIVATQMVLEEKFVSKYNVHALLAVGWEGLFGFLIMSALLVPMYFIPVGESFGNNPRHVMEDAYDGLYQLFHNGLLMLAFIGTIFSIAFFNFAGISVTKEMSATTRMVLDSMRTIVIWTVSLGVGWQKFHALQLLGFAILVSGMCVYNNLVFVPLYHYIRQRYSRGGPGAGPIDNNADAEERQNIVEPEA